MGGACRSRLRGTVGAVAHVNRAGQSLRMEPGVATLALVPIVHCAIGPGPLAAVLARARVEDAVRRLYVVPAFARAALVAAVGAAVGSGMGVAVGAAAHVLHAVRCSGSQGAGAAAGVKPSATGVAVGALLVGRGRANHRLVLSGLAGLKLGAAVSV